MYNIIHQRDIAAEDGSYLRIARTNEGVENWALLVTAPEGPFGGQIFCIGAMTSSSYTTYSFTNISKLGACPTSGTKTLSGCIR